MQVGGVSSGRRQALGWDDTDPADLSAGVEVIVNGMIYATGTGKGVRIPKIDAYMYITEYAGDWYPCCPSVAKVPGGIR